MASAKKDGLAGMASDANHGMRAKAREGARVCHIDTDHLHIDSSARQNESREDAEVQCSADAKVTTTETTDSSPT